MPADRRPSVLVTTEGTYPFEGGGVTTWADVVLRGLPDVDFHLVAVTGSAAFRLHKDLPAHVRSVTAVPLFGSAEPTEFTRAGEPFATTVLRRARTQRALVERRFVPLLVRLLDACERPERAGWDEAHLLLDLHRCFVRLDHRALFRSEATWNAFRDTVLAQEAAAGSGGAAPTLGDLVQALRWLYSFLLPLTVPVPRTDVGHATLAGFAALPNVVAKLEHGTPFVVTDHGIYLRERYIALSAAAESFFLKRFLLRLVHLVGRVCYTVADQVSPVCDHNARWELKMGVTADRVRTIYNGIDTERFRPPETEPPRSRPTVVTAARVFPLKDIETLVRACAVTRRRVPDVHFVVYGSHTVDKPYTDKCLALIDELGVKGNFTFAGFHSDPAALYHEGDVFALSSISEGFPFSVIEAMACGRPVVATDVGGVKEAIEGGVGIVVPPRGHEALGDGLADLLLDHDRRRRLAHVGPRTGRRAVRRRADAGGPPGHVPPLGRAPDGRPAPGLARRRGRPCGREGKGGGGAARPALDPPHGRGGRPTRFPSARGRAVVRVAWRRPARSGLAGPGRSAPDRVAGRRPAGARPRAQPGRPGGVGGGRGGAVRGGLRLAGGGGGGRRARARGGRPAPGAADRSAPPGAAPAPGRPRAEPPRPTPRDQVGRARRRRRPRAFGRRPRAGRRALRRGRRPGNAGVGGPAAPPLGRGAAARRVERGGADDLRPGVTAGRPMTARWHRPAGRWGRPGPETAPPRRYLRVHTREHTCWE